MVVMGEVAAQDRPRIHRLLSYLVRLRVQFVTAVFLAVIVPVSLRWGSNFDMWTKPEQVTTLIAAPVAIMIGLLLVRQISSIPGARETYYLAPAMAVSFAIVLAVMLLIRVDYNRFLFPTALAISIVWVFLTYALSERVRRSRFAVVPGGAAETLERLPQADWVPLSRPVLPSGRLDGIAVDLRGELDALWERFIADCALSGVRVFHERQLRESLSGRVEIRHLSENTLGSINPNAGYIKLKQGLDWLMAILALVILSPLLLVVAWLVKLDSPGPAIFRQQRIGFRGVPFTVYKFRTMIDGAATACSPIEGAITRDADPRITRLGSFLRRSRVDELPQILNILRGEMSWIGPRPEAVALSHWYEGELPFYRYRHIVRPGITGWAQINQGHVAEIDEVNQKLHYDFYYIQNFSPWLDIVIVLRTCGIMFTGFGAR
jgi:lipopolysaccharide/colanic/teichoic acid biosynthesis glycosyltransferase